MIFPPDPMPRRTTLSFMLFGLGMILAAGCAKSSGTADTSDSKVLRVATTTSMRDSGLLDELLPAFEREHDCRVDVVAVGTGAALKLGERGDADVVIVHARAAEEAFMNAGHGLRHEEFMYNNFVILGPEDDPAGIRGPDPVLAMQKIAEEGQRFVSRGDDSGTHKREMGLWELAGGRPYWNEYIESGQGMGPTLMIADEKRGYVLADMGTYLKFQDKVELIPLVVSESLRNPYAAIVVTSEERSKTPLLANAFVDFLISKEAQESIAAYRLSGRPLFHPTRLNQAE